MNNIYSLYVTTTKDEREYFYMLIDKIRLFKNFITIVHLDFYFNDTVKNININKKKLSYTKYSFNNRVLHVKTGFIVNLQDLVNCFESTQGNNIFMYSGHSNGIYLMRHNIRLLTIQDFCGLVYGVLKKKADLIIFDCCLCGNINCLSICKGYTDYVIASSGYWSELSMLQTKSIYSSRNYKDIITEMISLENNNNDNFITNYVLYNLNKYFDNLVSLTLKYKDQFKSKSYVIDKVYYKDLECCFKDLGIDIRDILGKIIEYQRFKVHKCHSVKKSSKASKSYPSSMFIILRSPVK